MVIIMLDTREDIRQGRSEGGYDADTARQSHRPGRVGPKHAALNYFASKAIGIRISSNFSSKAEIEQLLLRCTTEKQKNSERAMIG